MNELQWNLLRVSRSTQEPSRTTRSREWFQEEQVWNCEKAEQRKEKKSLNEKIAKKC